MNTIVVGSPSSVSRLLKTSRHLASIFELEVAKPERLARVTSSVRNMSFAKQRFDSTSKPLGRCLLNLDALTNTMHSISSQRPSGSVEYTTAFKFLERISQERNLMLLGMLADASAACLVLTRFFDKEAFRLEAMVEQLEIFRAKAPMALCKARMLDHWLHTSGFGTSAPKENWCKFLDKAPPLLGDVRLSPTPIITECLGRMVAWSTLAAEVAATEFPEVELLACVQVFKLSELLPTPSTARIYLQRLADAFNVEIGTGIDDLVIQLLEHQKHALALKGGR